MSVHYSLQVTSKNSKIPMSWLIASK
jgi:hypothetical protein